MQQQSNCIYNFNGITVHQQSFGYIISNGINTVVQEQIPPFNAQVLSALLEEPIILNKQIQQAFCNVTTKFKYAKSAN